MRAKELEWKTITQTMPIIQCRAEQALTENYQFLVFETITTEDNMGYAVSMYLRKGLDNTLDEAKATVRELVEKLGEAPTKKEKVNEVEMP